LGKRGATSTRDALSDPTGSLFAKPSSPLLNLRRWPRKVRKGAYQPDDEPASQLLNNTPCLWFADGAENSYDNRMTDNVFDMATLRPLDALIKELGGLDECRRLGFVFEDQNNIMSLSTAGMGYLCFVKAAGIASVAEAFAAGYQCRAEEYDATLDKV
jgi:hypothetical protein